MRAIRKTKDYRLKILQKPTILINFLIVILSLLLIIGCGSSTNPSISTNCAELWNNANKFLFSVPDKKL